MNPISTIQFQIFWHLFQENVQTLKRRANKDIIIIAVKNICNYFEIQIQRRAGKYPL